MMNFPHTPPSELDLVLQGLLNIKNIVRANKEAHYLAAKSSRNWYRLMGVTSIIISCGIGGSLFAELERFGPGARLALAIASFIAAILMAVQSFFRFSEQSLQHKSFASQYSGLERRAEAAISLKSANIRALKTELNELVRDMTETGRHAPFVAVENTLYVLSPTK